MITDNKLAQPHLKRSRYEQKNEPPPSTWLEILREILLKLFPFKIEQFRIFLSDLFSIAFVVEAIQEFDKSIIKTSEFFHNELPLPWRLFCGFRRWTNWFSHAG